MKYSIVIPTYNHCDDLLRPCIESIFQFSHMRDIELVISANGCVDNTQAYLDELATKFASLGMEDHLKIIWNDSPLGYSRSTNVGIKATTCEFVVLLNNDVILLDQPKNTWLKRLEAPFVNNPATGITCTTKMYSEHAGREFAIFYCVMIHKKVFERIGLLNESYGTGSGEDIEFSIETELAGFEVTSVTESYLDPNLKMWISDFPLYHKGEGTVHDPSLVQNWETTFNNNMLTVARKYNPSWLTENAGLVKQIELQSQANNYQEAVKLLKNKSSSIYEETFTQNLYSVKREEIEDKTVVDIGAHIGCFSIFALGQGAKKILAVEANKNTYSKGLLHVCAGIPQVKTLWKAVSAQDEQTLWINDNDTSSKVSDNSSHGHAVQTLSLQTLLAQENLTDDNMVLKMDVEGSEFDIILNTPPEVLRRFSTIYIEVHNNTNPDPRYQDSTLVQHALTSCGFEKVAEIPMFWFGFDGSVTELGVYNQKYIRKNPHENTLQHHN
jgi:FkbM family methyltransferase